MKKVIVANRHVKQMPRSNPGRIVILGTRLWDVDARRSVLGRRASGQGRGRCREHISAEKAGLNLLICGQDSEVDRSGCIGVQYASRDYTQLLQEHGIQISMSRKANPWDNAACESFLKTLKYEEVYRTEYRDLVDARASIGVFLEKVYNEKRLHSALGYLPPAEFERRLRAPTHKEAAARQLFL